MEAQRDNTNVENLWGHPGMIERTNREIRELLSVGVRLYGPGKILQFAEWRQLLAEKSKRAD